MEAFTAEHPSSKEMWIVERYDNLLSKKVIKQTQDAKIRRNTTVVYRNSLKSLAAFHAEKRKAKKKGLSITNFDSTTAKSERPKIKGIIKRPARSFTKILGYSIEED